MNFNQSILRTFLLPVRDVKYLNLMILNKKQTSNRDIRNSILFYYTLILISFLHHCCTRLFKEHTILLDNILCLYYQIKKPDCL